MPRRQQKEARTPRSNRCGIIGVRQKKKERACLPKRWMKYGCVGRVVTGSRFLPFKTPLRATYFRGSDPERVFNVSTFVTFHLKQLGEEIGMVIDLTNTTKYYDPFEWAQYGIEYVKINVDQRTVCRPLKTLRFRNTVANFYSRNHENRKLIGVHCTHGVNRTGFMICKYLIDACGWDRYQAISEFESCRGHGIEREAYIRTLLRSDDS